MRDFTRQRFHELQKTMAQTYGVASVSRSFNVSPEKAQNLQDKIVEQSTFLQLINTLPVDAMSGENILAGVTMPLASRTNVSKNNPRFPKHALSLSAQGYQLYATESDVALKYATIDAWAKFPDMFTRFQNYVNARIANDRELVGWYGESAAANTDLTTNTELQDVNIGWYQYMRANKPANVLTEGANTGEIRFGDGGDYETLDSAIIDLVSGIPTFMRAGLVALIGDDLVYQEKRRLLNAAKEKPTEKNALEASFSTFGGVSEWMTPSNFPARGLVVTSLKNLSLYYQDSSWRRRVVDEENYNHVAVYNSRNEGYTIETPEKFVALEFKNMKFPDGKNGWA